jgi:hypothetical protein
VEGNTDRHTEAVERAMVALRRSQSRRTLARLAARRHGSRADGPAAAAGGAACDVLDVIEAGEEAGRAATVTSVAAVLNIDQPRASKLAAGPCWCARQQDGARRRRCMPSAGRSSPRH